MGKDVSWPFFSHGELMCHCGKCGRADMDPGFMEWLVRVREEFDEPMVLTSAFRCPDWNERVSHTGRDGPHTTGKAVDVAIAGPAARRLMEVAIERGVKGIGVKQTGRWGSRFLHLDLLGYRVWSY